MNKTVAQFLAEHAAADPVSFHMPGHKGSRFYRENGGEDFLNRLVDMDITEIPGADNLFQTEGIISETMARYSRLYDTRATYLLVNGSSCGLIGSIMTCVPRGGRLIMARNCHKSVFNGLNLAGAEPVYAYPEMIEEYGITGEITVDEIERCLETCPEAAAVLLPSPNYYGICSDISGIAAAVHKKGKVLIVDQAHGAHLNFLDSSKAAERLGADIVIDSIHKTLASFTQSAVVNICSDKIDLYEFEDALQKLESTSPSYLLMASLDFNCDVLESRGSELMRKWRENLDWFYERAQAIEGLAVMKHAGLDDSKINLDMSSRGLDGLALEKELMKRHIFPELVTGNLVMCMTGIGNKRCDYEALAAALTDISRIFPPVEHRTAAVSTWQFKNLQQHAVPTRKIRLPLDDACGRVCAQSIIPYPPGIPMVCPGEEISREIIDYVKELRDLGENVMGVDDEGRVVVGY